MKLKHVFAITMLGASLFVSANEYQPNFKNTEITEFINIVGKNLKKTIIVDPNVRGKISVRSYDLMTEGGKGESKCSRTVLVRFECIA